ncbi:MAG: class I SAM-dependent methyltransferase [Thermoplasmatota archaeon]
MEKLKGLDLEDKKVLDAGTGACGMTKYLENWGAEVVSVDINKDWQKDCRDKTKSSQFLTADLSDLSCIEDESFDYVVCNFLVSALSQNKSIVISSVLREFKRVLKRDGMLVIIDYYPFDEDRCPVPCHNVQVELWRLENAISELMGKGHLVEFSPNVLSEELLNLGFKDTDNSTLLKEVPWPLDLLKEHEETILEDIESLEEDYLKNAFKEKLRELMDKSEEQEIKSGAIYELRAEK